MYDLIVVGGGAAGVFAAVNARGQKVALLEKSARLLSKVKISGGGRCNVTHACFDPSQLVKNYPRGFQELKGPFCRFQPRDTINWFESRGVLLKAEPDGRVFPVTDSSQTIIDCLLEEMRKREVDIFYRQKIDQIVKTQEGFQVGPYLGKRLILATGSSPEGYHFAREFGHTLNSPVPSLFTFNVPTSPLKELSGIAVESVYLKLIGGSFAQTGPLLITHFGFSGPAVLKLSAWEARLLHEKNYQMELAINWLPELTQEEIYQRLCNLKKQNPKKHLISENLFQLPKNLWRSLVVNEEKLNDFSLKQLRIFAEKLAHDIYAIDGKTVHKEEFVTCGGIHLKEVNFKTMESKICPGLYFAGEILDIDGVTGGFNFQNSWTSGFLAANGGS